MKKLIVLMAGLFLLSTGALEAAAPDLSVVFSGQSTVTVDSAYHNGFEQIDSSVVVLTDTSNVIFTMSGVAVLAPGERLYVAMGKDSANRQSASNLKADTSMGVRYIELPSWAKGTVRQTFSFQWIDSLETQTDLTDTFYLNAAVIGTAPNEKVILYNLNFITEIKDRD